MRNWPTFNIQRLFGLALGLKIAFAGLGYVLGMPFWLGLVAPMVVMLAYIIVGYHARDSEVSEDKFADSCYYLGFIFTIVSIIFCLLDIPKMTAGAGLRDIATRFGAAMVSTVLGMGVRVYLVSFRKDASDAMQDAETALLDSTRFFTAQLQENLKTLQSFEQQVVAAGQASVAGVQTQVEALARNFSETLSKFYAELNEENRAAFREMVDEVKGASAKLAASVDSYSQGMQTHLGNIEGKVTQFAEAVSARLDKTTFPDDYFATRLKAPLDQLALETQGVGGAVRAVNDEVKASAAALRSTLASVNSKMKAGAAVMETVVQMAEQHRALLDTTEKQASTYERFIERMGQIEEALDEVVRTAGTTNQASGEVLTRLAGVAADGTALREAIRASMAGLASGHVALSEALQSSITQVASKLDGHAQATAGLLHKVDEQTARFGQGSTGIVQAIEGHTERMDAVNQRFDAVASASHGLTRQLEAVVASNMQLIDGSRKRMEGFERAAAHSEKIVVSLAEIHPLLSRHVDALQPTLRLAADRGGILGQELSQGPSLGEMSPTTLGTAGGEDLSSIRSSDDAAQGWEGTPVAPQRPGAAA